MRKVSAYILKFSGAAVSLWADSVMCVSSLTAKFLSVLTLNLPFPLTSSLNDGVVVPIPIFTLPLWNIIESVIWSSPCDTGI